MKPSHTFLKLIILALSSFAPKLVAQSARQEAYAKEVAGHLVAAYERFGSLADHYGEDGYCGNGCSIWTMESANPSIRLSRLNFETLGGPQPGQELIGSYNGTVNFVETLSGKAKAIEFSFVYSGEDLTLDVLRIIP